jgi:hydroxymethylpyrimidine pyrophosphatase-like HAD family hydrolase
MAGAMAHSRQFRLVASDLDGTLLDPQGSLSARTLTAVQAVRAAGIPFVLATSRRLTGAAPVAAALGLDGPLILYDGAQVHQYPTGDILAQHALPIPLARQAAAIISSHGLRPIVQHGDRDGERLLVGALAASAQERGRERAYLDAFAHQIVALPASDLFADGAAPLRIVAFGPLRWLRPAAAALADLPLGWQLLPRGNYGTAELSVFAAGASKGAALLALAERLGIPRREVFAVGDGINDISLLEAAGFGVAMANGGPKVRAAADALAPSHAEDGAAWAIERYVLAAAPDGASARPLTGRPET